MLPYPKMLKMLNGFNYLEVSQYGWKLAREVELMQGETKESSDHEGTC